MLLQNLFDMKLVEMKVRGYMSGARNQGSWLCNVLIVGAWHDVWCAGR